MSLPVGRARLVQQGSLANASPHHTTDTGSVECIQGGKLSSFIFWADERSARRRPVELASKAARNRELNALT